MTLTVAVAGATGRVGTTIVEQIQHENKFSVIALTRSEHVDSPLSGVPYVQIDYDNIPALAEQLEHHDVQTVICTIGMLGDDCSEAQLNLIKAADRARTVQRFITSEFGYMTRAERKDVDPGVDWFLTAADFLKNSNLQYTRPVCGAFMDFMGTPRVRSNITPNTIAIDCYKREACIPGDGSAKITMIYSYDAATLIAKLLELDEWTEFSFCNGEDTTLGQALKDAEEVLGEKFEVTYVQAEDIASGNFPTMNILEGSGIQPQEQRDYAVFGYEMYLAGGFNLPTEGRLGDKFPGFKPRTVRQFLEMVWKQ
ncbi:uncharacterized protein N7469_011589 [Penicillium citrinum]|uniref:NmrA-like domain-containing protein n=1 Tax=Penicillium citrinum TaxID=5077 RepID=A0A9W9TBV2_PENCI|nr:uncharacterized protein N7469_011589 [Penicillium citrinum]KAJ5216724.1 hypothetical protein N7469_011589 [Penicillium citrinum]